MRRRLCLDGCVHICSGSAIRLIEAFQQVCQRIGQPLGRVELIGATQIRVNLVRLGHCVSHVLYVLQVEFMLRFNR